STFQVRASIDGHNYLLDPIKMTKAQVTRDGSKIARMSWFRPSPLRPYPAVTWGSFAAPADVSVGLALAAGFGVGANGFILHSIEVFGEVLEFLSFWRTVVRFFRFVGSLFD
nr:hypothetical protein [Micromonospora sp. DSM 115978]